MNKLSQKFYGRPKNENISIKGHIRLASKNFERVNWVI